MKPTDTDTDRPFLGILTMNVVRIEPEYMPQDLDELEQLAETVAKRRAYSELMATILPYLLGLVSGLISGFSLAVIWFQRHPK